MINTIKHINLLTFASSNWTIAPKRYSEQLAEIEKRFHFFKKTFIFNENDLGEAYKERFSRYFSDHGFAYWSWKPIAILKAMEQIEDGEMLFYIDGGCTFPMDNLDSFIEEFANEANKFYESDFFVGLTYFLEKPWKQFPGFPNITIVKKEILEAFNLQSNEEFLFRYPHWQSGLILFRKNKETIDLLKEWYIFYLENYELIIRSGFENKTGQSSMFIRNNADQAILQCMLFKKKTLIYNMNFLQNYNIIQHIRK